MSKLGTIDLSNFKLDDIADLAKSVDLSKLTSLVRKQEEEVKEEKKVKAWVIVLAIIGIIAVGCVAGYLVYRHFRPDYLEDFDNEFDDDDDFEDDDDFFVDEGEN